jgi:hypothetical protein
MTPVGSADGVAAGRVGVAATRDGVAGIAVGAAVVPVAVAGRGVCVEGTSVAVAGTSVAGAGFVAGGSAFVAVDGASVAVTGRSVAVAGEAVVTPGVPPRTGDVASCATAVPAPNDDATCVVFGGEADRGSPGRVSPATDTDDAAVGLTTTWLRASPASRLATVDGPVAARLGRAATAPESRASLMPVRWVAPASLPVCGERAVDAGAVSGTPMKRTRRSGLVTSAPTSSNAEMVTTTARARPALADHRDAPVGSET